MKSALRTAAGAVILTSTAWAAAPARAGLLGHTLVGESIYTTEETDLGTQTVNPTTTFTVVPGLAFYTATFTDTQLTIASAVPDPLPFAQADFNGVTFTDTGGNLGVTSFTVSSTDFAGFNASDVTLSQGTLAVNFAGDTLAPDGSATITFDAPAAAAATALPRPAVAGGGLLLALGLGRPRRRTATA